MRFIIFVIDSESNTAVADEIKNIDLFNEKLERDGHWLHAGGISHGEKATVVDNRQDAGIITSGSLYEAEEHYSGFWLIQAADEDLALDLAMQASKACNRKVELRPYLR